MKREEKVARFSAICSQLGLETCFPYFIMHTETKGGRLGPEVFDAPGAGPVINGFDPDFVAEYERLIRRIEADYRRSGVENPITPKLEMERRLYTDPVYRRQIYEEYVSRVLPAIKGHSHVSTAAILKKEAASAKKKRQDEIVSLKKMLKDAQF